MSAKKKSWEIYPALTDAVKQAHSRFGLTGSGHDFDHALRVAQIALEISDDTHAGNLAAAAGLCHNADRMFQLKSGIHKKAIGQQEIDALVGSWLRMEPKLSAQDRAIVVEAVLRHEQLNDEGGLDGPVLVALKDADRLVNLELDVVIRAGQFQPHLPAVDATHLLENPQATFFVPGSVLRNIAYCLLWPRPDGPEAIRLPRARKIAKTKAKLLQRYLDDVLRQRKEAGLVPYPPELL